MAVIMKDLLSERRKAKTSMRYAHYGLDVRGDQETG